MKKRIWRSSPANGCCTECSSGTRYYGDNEVGPCSNLECGSHEPPPIEELVAALELALSQWYGYAEFHCRAGIDAEMESFQEAQGLAWYQRRRLKREPTQLGAQLSYGDADVRRVPADGEEGEG